MLWFYLCCVFNCAAECYWISIHKKIQIEYKTQNYAHAGTHQYESNVPNGVNDGIIRKLLLSFLQAVKRYVISYQTYSQKAVAKKCYVDPVLGLPVLNMTC